MPKRQSAHGSPDLLLTSHLYQKMAAASSQVTTAGWNILVEFDRLRQRISQESKYIVQLFPEYPPHDEPGHLARLFALSDTILGTDLYDHLTPAELVVLCFGLYSHDWGMAVSDDEKRAIQSGNVPNHLNLLSNEPKAWQDYLANHAQSGQSEEDLWRDYARTCHAARSGSRLRAALASVSAPFADAVARVAEGHTVDMRVLRDPDSYPISFALLGSTANLAAVATYVRIVDLFDIGEDRTPYALWHFVSPQNPLSATEWEKHRALSPVTTEIVAPNRRRILVGGTTDDLEVYIRLADLLSWVQFEFDECLAILATANPRYSLGLETDIQSQIIAQGFEPIVVRFDTDRESLISLLSHELYHGNPHAFLRELLQNSVDAIDTRRALLQADSALLEGAINVSVTTADDFQIEWSDNGIGMDIDVICSYLARVGRSWYGGPGFADQPRFKHDPISRFGLGFLSCFTVADSIEIETRADPAYRGLSEGLQIKIPNPFQHFRITHSDSLPIGTTIRLRLNDTAAQTLSPESIRNYLMEIAGFVEHDIRLSVNGQPPALFQSAAAPPRPEPSYRRELQTRIVIGDDEDLHKDVLERTHVVSLQAHSPNHDAYYSAIFPNDPSTLRYAINKGFSFPGTRHFEPPANWVSQCGMELFLKGVRAGHVRALSRYWLPPRLLINLRKPSLVSPTLDRESVEFDETPWFSDLWKDISHQTKPRLLTLPALPARKAEALGSARFFGDVPAFALADWFSMQDWPVLALTHNEGIDWLDLAQLIHEGEILEAPIEFRHLDRELLGRSMSPPWSGPAVWINRGVVFYSTIPWRDAAAALASQIVNAGGFTPTRIRFLTSPPTDPVPLVSIVWTQPPSTAPHRRPADRASDWLDDHANWRYDLLDILGEDFPLLLQFPRSVSDTAAIGSLFWNPTHPKIVSIMEALLPLALRYLRNELVQTMAHEFEYYRHPSNFVGYWVASRIADPRMALHRFERLLDLAFRAGSNTKVDPLTTADFLDGTLGRYQNPHHYDLSTWKPDQGIGMPLI